MWYVAILLVAFGTLIYALYYNIRNYRVFIKVMTESERRMREFDDEYEEVSVRIAEGRERMKRRERLYDR
ncbi:hypothetical protein B7C51_24555 [Paenibacillus larvae subsp. pulvifaciens]|uniref:Uncharacterized protein n=1 Tax=Paenibacillus larvae subsp. pulvifaciens TaxID=1477 RepID=A0A1V0UZ69_9BACL|nr:hypothetical protein [Paenibacillus larvae]ARF70338.1 hypothetical protein B7C51_24555 [Paenibacillus larvae subsp. pulvifaciens]